MTTERAGQTSNADPCRWGCDNGQSWASARDRHEKNAHGAIYKGALAAEVDKLKAEADALRTALAGLATETRKIIAEVQEDEYCSLCGIPMCECWTSLTAAIASAEAALKGEAK